MALEDFRPMMERCSNCSACKWIPFDKIRSSRFSENCPSITYNHFNAYSARGRFQLALSLLEGRCTYTDTIINIIHQCTTCGSCDISCKICRYNLEPLEHHIELKCRAVADGKILPTQQFMIDSLKKEKTMIPGMPKEKRHHWAKDLRLKNLSKEKCELLFFPGCRYSYDKVLWKNAQRYIKTLIQAGADIGVLGDEEMCCAGRAYSMGFREEFINHSKKNIKIFENLGVKAILTPCADCYFTFKRLYPKIGSTFEVLHTVEYLDQLIKQGKIRLTKSVPITVTYHDPCHLGRLGEPYVAWNGREKKIRNQIAIWEPRRPRYNGAYGVYDPPRDVLRRIPGLRLVEMERIREYSWCCGAGGGCSETFPEFSTWCAEERVIEAKSTGAEALVTACPWCERNLMNTIEKDGQRIEVFDIIELVDQAI